MEREREREEGKEEKEKKFAMLFKSKKTMAIVDAKFETSEFALVKQRAFVLKE